MSYSKTEGGGPPQLQIDSGGAGWSDFGWLEDSIVNVQVREAMESFLQDLE